jgi:hypothetical protein
VNRVIAPDEVKRQGMNDVHGAWWDAARGGTNTLRGIECGQMDRGVGAAVLHSGLVAMAFVVLAGPALAREIGPGADFCAEANALAPGEELVLGAGEYPGPCTIRRGGVPGAPVVIRAADPARRPRLVFEGQGANVLSLRADHIVIRGLAIAPTQRGVDGVRMFSRRDITVEDCEFSGLGGIAVAATHASIEGLTVRGNVIRDSQATAMYFGCHDGAGCVVTGLVVERNYISGVRAPDPEIGYGIQVKLNSSGIIRDNVIVDTKGPGIMVYGSRDLATLSAVERNFTMGSQTSSGIVLGGGPALVRNNISTVNHEAGINLQDYGERGLLRGIVVAHNSIYGNREGGIIVPAGGLREASLINNAVHTVAGKPLLPEAQPGLRLTGNVNCASALCFADPTLLDFSPHVASGLVGVGAIGDDRIALREDYFGRRRGLLPTVGAIERPGAPVRLGLKP